MEFSTGEEIDAEIARLEKYKTEIEKAEEQANEASKTRFGKIKAKIVSALEALNEIKQNNKDLTDSRKGRLLEERCQVRCQRE